MPPNELERQIPVLRRAEDMAWCTMEQTFYFFGGQDTGTFGLIFQTAQYFDDTWQWDGKHWTQLQHIGPAARWPAGLTFDSVRKRSVLFGGFNQTGNFGDTWELYDPDAKVGGS